jgi:hypothetical protein
MATGKLSSDASDVLEGIVLTHKRSDLQELMTLAQSDEVIQAEIVEMHISGIELAVYIQDTQYVYNITSIEQIRRGYRPCPTH